MKSQNKKKTVYFLGAGFSRGAQYPLQGDLIDRIRTFKPPSVLSFDLDLFSAYDKFYKNRERVNSFLEKVFKDIPNPNLEDVFTILDQSISERTFCKGISWRRLINVDESFKSTILFSLHAASSEASPQDLDLYKRIAAHLLKKRLNTKEKVSVISVNWDSLVEDSIYYWIDRLKQQGKIDIDYCCYTMPLAGSPHSPSITQKAKNISNFKILKLHGSTNWLVCESCKKIYTGVGANFSALHLYFSNDHVCEECNDSGNSVNPKLLPFIITPTYLKAFPNPHIQNVWLNAYTELNEADKIVFIGYSLPEADFFVRSLLRRSIRNGTEIDVVLWKSDRPTAKQKKLSHLFAKHRYENFFGSKVPTFFFNGVEDYFINEVNATASGAQRSLQRTIEKF